MTYECNQWYSYENNRPIWELGQSKRALARMMSTMPSWLSVYYDVIKVNLVY